MFKKILFPLVAMFMLAGCATPPTTIDVSPKMSLPQQDPSLMGVTVSINGADHLPRPALPAAGSVGKTNDRARLYDWAERRSRSADYRE